MRKIVFFILIIIGIIPVLKKDTKQNYIIEDNYKIIISFPIINNKNVDDKIQKFIKLNRDNNAKQINIYYEKQIYKDITFIELNSVNYYDNYYKEETKVIAYRTNTYEEIKLNDVLENPYYISTLAMKLTENYSIRNINYDVLKNNTNFILNKDGLTFKYLFNDKINICTITSQEINKYLKQEYKIELDLLPKNNIIKRDVEQLKGKKLIALTFDDGPSNNTSKLLDELKKRNIKVTFFVLGNKIKEYEDELIKAYQDGHQIGSHTYNHKNLFYLNDNRIKYEIEQANNEIYRVTGYKPTALRVPYGNINDNIKSLANMNNILWNIDTLDWKYKNTNKVYKRIINNVKDGDIVLLHDTFKTTVSGVLKAIDKLKEEGYEFVTIDEMAYLKEINLDTKKSYFYFK